MADRSKIEWTDATWNPVRGCTRVSAGCGGPGDKGGCYAEQIAARFSDPGQSFHGFAERTSKGGRWTGKVDLIDDMLTAPMRWRRPRRIFVNSMSDLFHEKLWDWQIDRVFAVMALCPRHTFQVLTKRPERMLAYMTAAHPAPNVNDWQARVSQVIDDLVPERTVESGAAKERVIAGPLPNVWLGTSAEDQPTWDDRTLRLLATPAAVRFVSVEPMLGPVRARGTLLSVPGGRVAKCKICGHGHGFTRCPNTGGVSPQCHYQGCDCPGFAHAPGAGIDLIICGGESGPSARPMHPDWARTLRDDCAAAGVSFFFKQWGAWEPPSIATTGPLRLADMRRVGKLAAGRKLDGREHNDLPKASA